MIKAYIYLLIFAGAYLIDPYWIIKLEKQISIFENLH
jgi:hypothetical protein